MNPRRSIRPSSSGPGRFDRVVAFPIPSAELRQQYFLKLDLSFDVRDLQAVVEESDGMSFAQLREIHIMAGQKAFAEGRPITGEDLLDAVWTMRQTLLFGNLKTGSAGFAKTQAGERR